MDIHGVDEVQNKGFKVVVNLPLGTEGWRNRFFPFLEAAWSSRC